MTLEALLMDRPIIIVMAYMADSGHLIATLINILVTWNKTSDTRVAQAARSRHFKRVKSLSWTLTIPDTQREETLRPHRALFSDETRDACNPIASPGHAITNSWPAQPGIHVRCLFRLSKWLL